MKRTIIAAIVALGIGGLAGWLGHDWRSGVNLADCAIVEIKVRLYENIEMLRALQNENIDYAKELARKRLEQSVALTERYDEGICTRAGSAFCESLMEIVDEARQLVGPADAQQ